MNGYSDTGPSESQENITVICIDSDPLSNTRTTSAVAQEKHAYEASEAVQVCDGSDMFVVQEESTTFCSAETVVERHSVVSSESLISDDSGVSVPVAFSEATVQECSEGAVSCSAELAQNDMQMCMVECMESAAEEFEVATACTLDSDDSMSVCSHESSENIVRTCDIVMECGEKIVEEVPMSPVEKALTRRG